MLLLELATLTELNKYKFCLQTDSMKLPFLPLSQQFKLPHAARRKLENVKKMDVKKQLITMT